MEENKKVTKFFSAPLMKQNIKANWVLCLAILFVTLLLGNVMNYAASLMQKETSNVDVSSYQKEFYTYLGGMADFNTQAHGDLSYEDYVKTTDKEKYQEAFTLLNQQTGGKFSTENFEKSMAGLKKSGIEITDYVKEFEYNYALSQSKGVFSKKDLTVKEMLATTLKMMGVDADTVEKMGEMDTGSLINHMYYTVTGILPLLLLLVILANSLIAELVDQGSMAYVLSTPTKRSAVAITQMIFLIVVPLIIVALVGASRIGTSFIFYDEVNVKSLVALFIGMYILLEAIAGICYLGSTWFSQSKKALGFGGGLTVWFFLASLIGMFGAENMVNSGMGIEELGIFNKLTLIGLFDTDALATIGTSHVDTSFVWKLAVLIAISVTCYTVGALRFTKKDLPL